MVANILNNSYAAYINLAQRVDRNDHMKRELARVNIQADRFEAYTPDQFPEERYSRMRAAGPGAIGCMMSQMEVMIRAKALGKHAFVMEDDLIFCDDIHDRLRVMETLPAWDIIWLGGTYHLDPTWHAAGHNHPGTWRDWGSLCDCTLNRDWEPTQNPDIVRTYGAWSTYAYIVNVNSINTVLAMLNDLMTDSVGIDYSMIAIQPKLKTFAFNPGCVKQMDNQSNIGSGWTRFSGFEKLGKHWFQNTLL